MRPYIGITGFMASHEVVWLAAVQRELGTEHAVRDLMVGVLTNSKTLAGGTNRWPGRYPKVEKIPSIFTEHPRILNLIHYNTDDPSTLTAQLNRLVDIGGPNLHGIQLNIPWPAVAALDRFRWATFHEQRIVLQIGRTALAAAEHSPTKLAEMVGRYLNPLRVIDAVLLDPSGGEGRSVEPGWARPFLRAISDHHSVELGIAGGLSYESLDLVEPLLEEFPCLSIDAEGRLRRRPQDYLDLEAAAKYFEGALALFGRYTRT
jgi:hypothetical protein